MRLWLVALVAACSGAQSLPQKKAPVVPKRAATAGDRLLAFVPDEASLVVEIDLLRLRDNPKVGPLIRKRAAQVAMMREVSSEQQSVYANADTLVVASLEMGTEAAASAVIIAGKFEQDPPGMTRVAPGVFVEGSERSVLRIKAAARNRAESMLGNEAFLRLRALPMPAAAKHAAIRTTMMLGFEQRIDLARTLAIDVVPKATSVWADIVDDFALVIALRSKNKNETQESLRSLLVLWRRIMASPTGTSLSLAQLRPAVRVEHKDQAAAVVVVVGPAQLDRFLKQEKK